MNIKISKLEKTALQEARKTLKKDKSVPYTIYADNYGIWVMFNYLKAESQRHLSTWGELNVSDELIKGIRDKIGRIQDAF